jgi:hypothetical protein
LLDDSILVRTDGNFPAMSLLDQLGVALGLATLAGVNLYLTALVAGLAIRFNWIELAGNYEHLEALGNPWILGIAGTMFAIEFFADKIPWLDSIWDLAHTVIRPAGAILLGLAVLGEMNPLVLTLGGLLAGTAGLSTHGVKSGIRALLNLSPEPVSNSVASVAEDGLVLGGLGFVALFPAVALFVFVALVIACAVVASYIWKRIFRISKQRQEKPGLV